MACSVNLALPTAMSHFNSLPPELVQLILSFLDEEPPSRRNLYEEPSEASFCSNETPLKNLSSTSRFMRHLTVEPLSLCMKVNVDKIQDMHEYLRRCGLTKRFHSILICPPSSPEVASSSVQVSRYLSQVSIYGILEAIGSPETLTIILPPKGIAMFLPYTVDTRDDWAFKTPLQILHFTQSSSQAKNLARAHSTTPLPGPRRAYDYPKRSDPFNIFSICPWTHCTFNEGSSVGVYSTYEHFLRGTPSIFQYQSSHKMQSQVQMIRCLASFDYIAVFPINHMSCVVTTLSSLENLQCLRVQLAPSASGSKAVNHSSGSGPCPSGDLWMEFEECYICLVTHIIGGHFESLREFTSLDYSDPGPREILDRIVQTHYWPDNWIYRGDGHWKLRE